MARKKGTKKSPPLAVKITAQQRADVIAGRDTAFTMRDLKARMKLSSATIYKQVHAGLLPKPVQLGLNRVVWLESMIAAQEAA
jgi:predicted DNA-binding transcriptional regulator AlpA